MSPPTPSRHTLRLRVRTLASDLRVVERGGFHAPRLVGFDGFGAVGMPELPRRLRYIALPGDARVLGVEVTSDATVVVPGPLRARPVQPPETTPEVTRAPIRRRGAVPLRASLVQGRARYPQRLVVVGRPRRRGDAQVVPLQVRPLQYDPALRTYVLHPELEVTVSYEVPAPGDRRPVDLGWADALDAEAILTALDGLGAERRREVTVTTPIPCVIITDDTFWPESVPDASGPPRPPRPSEAGAVIGLDGAGGDPQDGPVAHFERLAAWKTARGVPTRVVKIRDIVAKLHGDCTEGEWARDLQEVIRNFIIMAHRDWGTKYVLLGGHPRLLPIRSFLGHISCGGAYPGWDFHVYDDDTTIGLGGGPPPRGRSFYGGRTILCHDSILGLPTRDTVLVTRAGRSIPFKDRSDAALGWYFEDERFLSGPLDAPVWWPCPRDFSDTSMGTSICNLVVEGPRDVIDDDMHWALPERLVPTDLYYAELTPSPQDSHGHSHAFDRSNNRLYGQYAWDAEEEAEVSVDGVDVLLPHVEVGRAPVLSGREAGAFVDKVLAYEALRTVDGAAIDPGYLQRELVVADVWRSDDHVATHVPCWSSAAQPEPGEFVKLAGEARVLVRVAPGVLEFLQQHAGARTRMVARFNAVWGGTDVPVDPRAATSDAAANTWRFVQPSGAGVAPVDAPSELVELVGPAFVHEPRRVLWYYSPADACDDATSQAEELVDGAFAEFSEFEVKRCLIESHAADGPAIALNAADVRAGLDRGPHFVGVYGHGSENGLSYIYWHDNDACSSEFRNAGRPFIMYANSCLTANPTRPDCRSLGEVMVTHPHGAVAYVGYTRVGFQEGHAQQQRFWRALRAFGRLGRAAQVRVAETLWQVYEQILYGDPEMRVWTRRPRAYLVVHPQDIDRSQALAVVVLSKAKRVGLPHQRVTVMGRWRGGIDGPSFLASAETDAGGEATVDLSGLPADLTELTLTVAPKVWTGEHGHYAPYSVTLPVYGLQGGWRRCRHCSALYFHGDRPSRCPARAGGHEPASDERYRVLANNDDPPGQQGWRWCRTCQALHRPGGVEACADGGVHDDAGSGHYAVEKGGDAEAAASWRLCDRCRVLHLVVHGEAGPCFAGGSHGIAGSFYRVRTSR